jgi:hypothetical protein
VFFRISGKILCCCPLFFETSALYHCQNLVYFKLSRLEPLTHAVVMSVWNLWRRHVFFEISGWSPCLNACVLWNEWLRLLCFLKGVIGNSVKGWWFLKWVVGASEEGLCLFNWLVATSVKRLCSLKWVVGTSFEGSSSFKCVVGISVRG